MGIMNWQALAEQLREIGVVVPAEREALTKSASARPVGESSARESGTPPAQPSIKPPVDKTCEVDASSSSEIEEVSNTISLATAAGVTFFRAGARWRVGCKGPHRSAGCSSGETEKQTAGNSIGLVARKRDAISRFAGDLKCGTHPD